MKFYVEIVLNKSDLEDDFIIEENVFFQDEKIVIKKDTKIDFKKIKDAEFEDNE